MRFHARNSLTVVLFLGLAFPPRTLAQIPTISQAGILNAASWSSPLAPGAIVAIFGANLAATQQTASAPTLSTLGGTSVTINGVAAPLAFVSPGQVNAYVPASIPVSGTNITAVPVVVTTPVGSSTAVPVAFDAGAPGFFSADGSGCGQAAALNIAPEGSVSLNSASNSAAPGDYVVLFGTGFGLAAQQPPDGIAAGSASSLESVPRLFIDSNPVPSLSYAGLAPSLAGVDQINFQIPASTRNGCSVPVSAAQLLGSPSVTISVQSGRGPCTNPPIQSWGQISLVKAVFSGPGSTPLPATESFAASFPSGPAVEPPAPEANVFAPSYVANVAPGGGFVIETAAPIYLRACPVAGYSSLSAGVIQIQPPSGSPATTQPQPLQTGGVSYEQTLPAGFIAPRTYTITGTQGNSVGLMANLSVGSPIQLQTQFPAGTTISSSKPLTVQWTGGDPGTLVKGTLISGQGLTARASYTYANATSGSLTIPPTCSGNPPPMGSGVVCSFGLPLSANAQITVQVLPASPATVTAPGLTGPVQLTWQYSWNFSGLSLGE